MGESILATCSPLILPDSLGLWETMFGMMMMLMSCAGTNNLIIYLYYNYRHLYIYFFLDNLDSNLELLRTVLSSVLSLRSS